MILQRILQKWAWVLGLSLCSFSVYAQPIPTYNDFLVQYTYKSVKASFRLSRNKLTHSIQMGGRMSLIEVGLRPCIKTSATKLSQEFLKSKDRGKKISEKEARPFNLRVTENGLTRIYHGKSLYSKFLMELPMTMEMLKSEEIRNCEGKSSP